MPRVLLFCVAEEAKPFVREVLKVTIEEPTTMFYLVESNICPTDRTGFKTQVQDGDTFETDFIGSSDEDCKAWALGHQYQVNFIERDIIAIVDARSAQDTTILVSLYVADEPGEPPLEFDGFGALPGETNTWYDYRIDYGYAPEVHTDLLYGVIDTAYPTYFGRKEELTDERGVFDVARARRFVLGLEPNQPELGNVPVDLES